MGSYTSGGAGNWYAWWRGANGDYQQQNFPTREEAAAWAARWRETNVRGDRCGVSEGEPISDLSAFAALRDGPRH